MRLDAAQSAPSWHLRGIGRDLERADAKPVQMRPARACLIGKLLVRPLGPSSRIADCLSDGGAIGKRFGI